MNKLDYLGISLFNSLFINCKMASSASQSDIGENENYFFGKITGDEGREILYRETGGAEGSWLIRESISSSGNYVLSVIMDGEVQHILIHSHAQEDAVYSLTISDNAPVFHGLDTLILYYHDHPLKPMTACTAKVEDTLYSTPQDAHSSNKELQREFSTVQYTLHQPCYLDPLPPHTKLHGSCNLLHRAVQQENTVVVKELLKSGYRKVDARTPEGLTALHLACLVNNEEIVKELLDAGARVKIRDIQGLSPLHYVCRQNKASIVCLLISHDPSAIQWRARANAEVSLHEAAASRSLLCVETLLQCGAPSKPRNTDNQTPADLALAQNAADIYNILMRHSPAPPKFPPNSYHHGPLNRQLCHQFLSLAEKDGIVSPSQNISNEQNNSLLALKGAVFLVRNSDRTSRCVLSIRYLRQTRHFEIIRERDGSYCIDDGPLFSSIEYLVDHHTRHQDGLPALLTIPVSPSEYNEESFRLQRPLSSAQESGTSSDSRLLSSWQLTTSPDNADTRPLLSPDSSREDLASGCFLELSNAGASRDCLSSAFEKLSHRPTSLNLPLPLPSATNLSLTTASPSANGNIEASGDSSLTLPPNNNNATTPTLDGNKTSEICGRIDINSLSVGETLGVGEFGSVLKGVWISPAGDQMPVAVKTLHATTEGDSKQNFFQEAKLMMDLNHPYIVKLLGVCHGPPIAMVQELAPMGALLDYLLDYPRQIDPKFHLKLWPAQAALGMQYLEKKKFVHRDLACRNLLLSSTTLVKITDFGLSRATGQNTDYYKASKGGKWPLKWNAPESINYGKFTHSSDVWSYGVTLWEMYTYGDQPYGDLPGYKVINLLENGERLPQPDNCSNVVYEIMLRCWHMNPSKRPTFARLAHHFSTGEDYVDVKPYLKIKG